MPIIKASCGQCGDIELEPLCVRLEVWDIVTLSNYQFDCPKCKQRIQKPANRDVVDLLLKGGVIARDRFVPPEAKEPHCGPVITNEDVEKFAAHLRRRKNLAKYAK